MLDQSALPALSGTPRPGTSRSLDLLIEMQGKAAGLDFSQSTRAIDRSARALPPTGSPDLRQTPLPSSAGNSSSGLFGSGAAPAVVTKGHAGGGSEWRPAAGRASLTPGGAAGDHVDSARSGVDQVREPLWQLPRVAIRWMRDNRLLVVAAAVALLALLWGTTFAFSPRRR